MVRRLCRKQQTASPLRRWCLRLKVFPLEFRLLNCKPEPWTPADSLAWLKMMCWTLYVNWETEILRARLIARLGAEKAASLEPALPPEWVRVVPPGVDYSCIGSAALKRAAQSRQFTGPGSREGVGSNNWVLSGSRTNTGLPILANDMHLAMTMPAIWYQNHLSSDDLHVTGVSFPGLPLVIAGHNEQLAWGFTNGFPDVQDLYMEHLRQTPEGGTKYEFKGQWLKADVLREEIKVKDAGPVIEEVIVTHHGPIIIVVPRILVPSAAVEAASRARSAEATQVGTQALQQANAPRTLYMPEPCHLADGVLMPRNVPTNHTDINDTSQ